MRGAYNVKHWASKSAESEERDPLNLDDPLLLLQETKARVGKSSKNTILKGWRDQRSHDDFWATLAEQFFATSAQLSAMSVHPDQQRVAIDFGGKSSKIPLHNIQFKAIYGALGTPFAASWGWREEVQEGRRKGPLCNIEGAFAQKSHDERRRTCDTL